MVKPYVAVIMAGGAGTRFWPMSTQERPKQFLALTSERSLLQMSFDRLVGLVGVERILVLTSEAYVDLVAEQLPELPSENIVGEPCRRDTAAAVCLAGLLVQHRFGDVPMAILTADHVITPISKFHLALNEALESVGSGVLYTLGIKPNFPATQFGYLEVGEELGHSEIPHFQLKSFKEKPDQQTAEAFLLDGSYYWNSGMFAWKTQDILDQFHEHLPQHIEILKPVVSNLGSPDFSAAFAQLEAISVDYAILEKAPNIRAVIPDVDWDDVGSWLALGKYLDTDEGNNHLRGRILCQESVGNTVFAEDLEEEIVLLGVEDLVVVRTPGRTLVARKDNLDLIKKSVLLLNADSE